MTISTLESTLKNIGIRMKIFLKLTLPSIFALSCNAYANESAQSLSSVALEAQVISATGQLSNIDDTPIRTEVISAQQLEFMQAKVLTDALQYSAGLKVQKTVKQGSKVSMQGVEANYVLVLKDGLPFISPTGSETDLSQISLAGIERIEIIKGSGSALYGSSAMGGVINLISNEVEVSQLEFDHQQGRYQSGSEQDLQQSSIFASKVLGRQKISLQAFRKSSPDTDLDKSSEISDGAKQTLNNLELRLDHHHGAGRYTNSRSMSYLRVNYLTDEKTQSKNPSIYPGQGSFASEYNTDSKKISIDSGIRQLTSDLFDQGSILLRYENYEEQSGNRDVFAGAKDQRKVNSQLLKIESQFNNQLQFGTVLNSLSYGLSSQKNAMQQNKIGTGAAEIDDKKSSSLETYVQNDVITQSYGEFIPGLRVQYDSDFGFHSNAKMNWMKNLGSINNISSKLRISYGQGYRTPDLKQRFYLFDHSNLGYIITGNEDLKPEESNNINTTLSLNYLNHRFDLSAYYNEYKNKIETVYDGQIDNISQNNYQNVGRAITQGADASLTLQPSKQLYWQQSIAYLETENTETGRRLENQPLWSYKTQLNYSVNQDLVFSLYGSLEKDSYKGMYDSNNDDVADAERKSTLDLIQVWDLKVGYKVNSNLKLTAGIDNVLNEVLDPSIDANVEVDERSIESRLLTVGMNLTF